MYIYTERLFESIVITTKQKKHNVKLLIYRYVLTETCPLFFLFLLFFRSLSAFVREFLSKLSEIEAHEKTTGICKVAYNDTLAQFHPWLVRKGALVAMYALPTREQLLNKVCQDVEQSTALLPDVLDISKMVYERTEKLYSDYELHELP